jgi:Tfp pilus assembly protein FimT
MALSAASVQAVAAARMIVSDLQYAQNEAIAGQTPVTITYDVGAEAYTLSNASGVLIHPITEEDYVVDFSSDSRFNEVDIVSASFAGDWLSFDEIGAPDESGSITLQAGPHAMRIDVAYATGAVTIVDLD